MPGRTSRPIKTVLPMDVRPRCSEGVNSLRGLPEWALRPVCGGGDTRLFLDCFLLRSDGNIEFCKTTRQLSQFTAGTGGGIRFPGLWCSEQPAGSARVAKSDVGLL